MGRRIALLIATDGYGDPGLNRLRAPGRDAGQLAQLLEDQSIGRFDHVRVLLNRPKAEIEAAIEELLTNRMPDDLVLLYIACHGLANDVDRLFFATVDTQLARRNTTAIRASLVHDLLDECEAAAKIVLLDCCYSGLFNRGLSTRSERRIDVEREVLGKGTVVLTSTTSLAYAYEGTQFTDNGEPASVFTGAVIEGLRSGAADADRDGIVTPDELYDYVFRAVISQLGEEQKPTKKGRALGASSSPTRRRSTSGPGAGERSGPRTAWLWARCCHHWSARWTRD
ncbi:caspase domain-containing protein [Streptosporangium lutulentum]